MFSSSSILVSFVFLSIDAVLVMINLLIWRYFDFAYARSIVNHSFYFSSITLNFFQFTERCAIDDRFGAIILKVVQLMDILVQL